MTPRRSPTLALAAAVEAARAGGETIYSLSTPTFTERMANLDLETASTMLSPPQGVSRLREQMHDTMLQKWDLPNHDVLISAGAKAAILSALRASCNAGDRVVILAPYWPSYADIVRMLFMEPVIFETRFEDGFAVDSSSLGATMAGTGARAIVLSNPANPTGRIHPGREIDAIAGIARESGALLLIDESFSGVLFAQDKWRESVCSAYERLVVVNSFSKSHHLQGLRVGLCAAQGQLFDDIVVGAPDGGECGIESRAGRGPGSARRRWRDAGLQPGTRDDHRVRARSGLGMPSGGRELLCISPD